MRSGQPRKRNEPRAAAASRRPAGALTAGALTAGALLLALLTACMTPQKVPVSAAHNMRDAGGYETADGQRVRRGLLFRSDDLAELGRGDLDPLAGLGLKRLYDLRYPREREASPNRLPYQHRIEVVEIPIYYPPLDRAKTKHKILNGDVENGDFESLMIEANRAFPYEYREEWARLLRGLAEPGALPALIHCTDGKDRTGFAVALVLRAIGVPEETVFEDYLVSNEFLAYKASILSVLASVGSLFRVPPDEIRPLLVVRREYLEAAFAAIEARHGSIEAYLTEGLGLDDATLARLRAVLLEEATG